MDDLKNCIKQLLASQQKFTSKNAFIQGLSKMLPAYHPQLEQSFQKGGFSFDAYFILNNATYVINVVIKQKNNDTERISNILSQMEEAEKEEIIRGGVVVYITNQQEDWTNNCLALEPSFKFGGVIKSLKNTYVYDWDASEAEPTHYKYAVFYTKGANLQ